MINNEQHYTTFIALLKLWGLRPDIAELVSQELASLEDNDAQDKLIAIMTDELQKSQKPPQIEHNS